VEISRYKSGHTAIFGITRSGKTVFALKLMASWPGPAIFINTQHEETNFITATRRSDVTALARNLLAGNKIDYIPSENDNFAIVELELLMGIFRRVGESGKKLLLLVDEAHVYAPQSKGFSPLYRVARRGLRFNIHGVFISQRPADVSKVVVTQCSRHVIFSTNFEGPYFKNYGIPYEEVQKKLTTAGNYHYVVWEGGQVSPVFKEKL
jgi:DNA helicase HerA-like ATPase